jgi:hypothetical protein
LFIENVLWTVSPYFAKPDPTVGASACAASKNSLNDQ